MAFSSSLIAFKTLPNEELPIKTETPKTSATKIRESIKKKIFSENTNPNNSGRPIAGIPSGPRVTLCQFKKILHTIILKPRDAKA